MIVNLVVLLLTGAVAYYVYTKVIADKIDCPANNESVKGLEKEEIKEAIKEGEVKVKEVKDEIKTLEKERKDILAGSEEDKGEKAKEKLEEKEAKLVELKEIETSLADLKVVDKGDWKAMMPNKLSWNNAMWIGSYIIGIVILYRIMMGVINYVWRSIFPNE